MKRLTTWRMNEDIEVGIDLIPPRIWSMVEYTDLFVGCDPVFAGLHFYVDTDDGRSYRETAHIIYPYHQGHLSAARRNTTIVLPTDRHRLFWGIVHEFGHALDERLGFEHAAIPIDDYAKTNRAEAFATAFEAYCSPGYPDWHRLYSSDPVTVALFDRLASE